MSQRRENMERKREMMLEKMRAKALAKGGVDMATLPAALAINDGKRVVRVFVEGYEDVAFFRPI